MASRTLHQRIKSVVALAPIQKTTSAYDAPAAGSAGVDIALYEAAMFLFQTGVQNGGSWKIQVCVPSDPANPTGTYVAAPSSEVLGISDNYTAGLVITAGTDDGKVFAFSYVGIARYIKVRATPTGTTNAQHAVLVELGGGHNLPF